MGWEGRGETIEEKEENLRGAGGKTRAGSHEDQSIVNRVQRKGGEAYGRN